jgi:ABC-type transport system substrate-binding protein
MRILKNTGSNSRKFVACFLMLLLLGFLPFLRGAISTGPVYASGASSSGCIAANTLRETQIDDPSSFNILDARGAASFNVIQTEYASGLWPKLAPNGSMDFSQSDIDWYSHNSNYTQWEFNIRPGLTWSNGHPVNASDVVATFSANFALNSQYNPFNTGSEVTNMYAQNNSLVVFVLNQSDAHLGEELSSQEGVSGTYPASMVSEGPAANFFNITNIADGPFYVANYSDGTHQLTMYRNPYFRPLPKICQIDINFVEGTTTAANYISSDATDLSAIDPTLVQTLLRDPHAGILDEKATAAQLIYWNTSQYPYNQVAFRQAIAYTINDSQVISQDLNGYGIPGYNSEGFVPSTTTSLYSSNQQTYPTDLNKSLQLLQSIGYKQDSSGTLHFPNGTAVSLKLWVDSDTPSDLLSADTIQSDLSQLGITVTIISLPEATIYSYIQGDTQGAGRDMFLDTHGGADPPDAWLDAQPVYSYYWFGIYTPTSYLGSTQLDNEYQSNLTAIDQTANAQQEQQYENNIQMLYSQSLPNLIVSWPDTVFAYNTLHWSGWGQYPAGWYQMYATLNWNYLLNLSPTSGSGSQTSSSTSASVSQTGLSSTGTITSTISSATTAFSSTGSTSAALTIEIALVVVIVILVAAVGLLVVRRRPRA